MKRLSGAGRLCRRGGAGATAGDVADTPAPRPRAEAPGQDRPVEAAAGPCPALGVEFAPQRIRQVRPLAQRLPSLTGQGVQAHQAGVGLLVRRLRRPRRPSTAIAAPYSPRLVAPRHVGQELEGLPQRPPGARPPILVAVLGGEVAGVQREGIPVAAGSPRCRASAAARSKAATSTRTAPAGSSASIPPRSRAAPPGRGAAGAEERLVEVVAGGIGVQVGQSASRSSSRPGRWPGARRQQLDQGARLARAPGHLRDAARPTVTPNPPRS